MLEPTASTHLQINRIELLPEIARHDASVLLVRLRQGRGQKVNKFAQVSGVPCSRLKVRDGLTELADETFFWSAWRSGVMLR